MNETSAYIVTAEVLKTARAMASIAARSMTEEEFEAAPPQADDFLEKSTRLFMERHAKIHQLIADQAHE